MIRSTPATTTTSRTTVQVWPRPNETARTTRRDPFGTGDDFSWFLTGTFFKKKKKCFFSATMFRSVWNVVLRNSGAWKIWLLERYLVDGLPFLNVNELGWKFDVSSIFHVRLSSRIADNDGGLIYRHLFSDGLLLESIKLCPTWIAHDGRKREVGSRYIPVGYCLLFLSCSVIGSCCSIKLKRIDR